MGGSERNKMMRLCDAKEEKKKEKEVFLSQQRVLVLVQREQRQGTLQLIQVPLVRAFFNCRPMERVWVRNWDDKNNKKQDQSGFGICMFQKP